MPAVDPKRVRDLFLAAAELPADGRPAYLAAACSHDADLRAAVDRLLAAHSEPASILNLATAEYTGSGSTIGSATTNFFASPAENGTILVGRYKLGEPIGEGGMGAVWTARQTEPVKRMVAVKLIKPGMDSKAVLARFEAERQALALMDHPNIARVLDAGTTEDNRPFFVMELVKGVPITKYCDDRKLTTRERLELFVPVCHAIQHAHQKGVIHRDIKPSNVLVALYDDRAVPKVIDFGVAKATGQLLTEMTLNTGFGSVVGTPQYMSPEQATFNNLDIDTRSDVYALGVLLYELLTGSTPFKKQELEEAGLLEMLRVVREVDPPRPSTRISTAAALPTLAANRGTEPGKLRMMLRNELDWIVMKALEKDRSRRYETANGLAFDINRHLSGEEVAAVPPSIGYRVHKFISKNRGPVIAATMVLAALVCGVIGTTIGLLRAETAREAEANERRRAEDQTQISMAESKRASDEATRANAEAAKAKASTEAEKIAVEKSQRLLGRTNATEGIRLVDGGDIQLGLLRIANALSKAPDIPHVQDIVRLQLALCGVSHQSHLRVSLQAARNGKVVPTAFSSDGRWILSASDDKTVQIWDIEKGKPISPPLVHPATITKAVFSPDGQKVWTGCNDGTICVWNFTSPKPILQHQLKGIVVAFGFTPKGVRALTSNSDGTLQVWNAESATSRKHLPFVTGLILSAAFSPDCTRILIGSSDTSARLFDAEKGTSLSQLQLHTDSVETVAFSPDGLTLLTGSKDQTARLWSADTSKPISSALQHPDTVASVAFSPDGKSVLTGCGDNVVRLWRVGIGKQYPVTVIPNIAPIETVAFSSKGNLALTATIEGVAQLWELGNSLTAITQSAPLDAQVTSTAFSPDGRRMAIGYKNGMAQLWDFDSRNLIPLTTPLRVSVTTLAFSPDSRRVVTGFDDKSARVYDALTGNQISNSLKHNAPVRSAAFSPDGNLVAIGTSVGTVQIWNPNTSQQGKTFSHDAAVQAMAISPDGKRIMTGGANKMVRIWDVEKCVDIAPFLRHPESVESVTFSKDGRYALTGCKDGSVRVFEIGMERPISLGPVHNSPVRSVAFSPDGRWALTGSNDGIARLWDVETGIALSPRLQHTLPIVNAAFSDSGKQVILRNFQKAPRILDISLNDRDKRPVQDILGLAQLNCSHSIDENGRAVPLSGEEWYSLWTSLRAKYPEEFTLDPSATKKNRE